MVKAQLQTGANPNTRARDGSTPLHAEVLGGKIESVVALLQGGADPDARDYDVGVTALLASTKNGDTEIVEALVQGGADLNARDTDGESYGNHYG